MKAAAVYLPILFFLIAVSCEKEKSKSEHATPKKPFSSSYEFVARDTINKTDSKGLRQGKWVVRERVMTTNTVFTVYKGDPEVYRSVTAEAKWVVREKGVYKDDKKQGLWEYYSPGGKVKESSTYRDGILIKTN